MSIFSSILQKIGIGKPAATAAATNPPADVVDKAKADAAVSAAMAKAAEEARARVAAQAKAAAAAIATPAIVNPATVNPESMAPASVAAPIVAAPAAPAPSQPTAIPVVDVVSKLEDLAKSHPGLNWKVSIADLLRLLDIDNSYENRKSLAVELGCPANLMGDSASMNIWLHKTVLQKIAENGGNIPASLLD